MSNFSEVLKDLMEDQNLNGKELAEAVGINASGISHYLSGKTLPTVEFLVKLADYFHCSADFLLGREEENPSLTFRPCPPFATRIDFFIKEKHLTTRELYKDAEISKSRFYDWKSGKRQPSLDNVLKLADRLQVRVDYVLGRES